MAPFDDLSDGPFETGRRMLTGLAWRIGATAALIAGGFVVVLLYLGFWATHFAWYQNLAVVLSVGIVVPTAVTLLWVAWGLSLGRRWARGHLP